MIYLLYGDNDFLIREELDRIRDSLGPPDMLSLNTARLSGQTLTLPELQGVCSTVPFLAPARLVIVEGLLGRFNRPPARGQDSSQAAGPGAEAAAAWEGLGVYAGQLPESTCLVFVEGALPRNNPLLGPLSRGATVREFRTPRGPALEEWVRSRAAQLGYRANPAAIRLLVELAGDNLSLLTHELEKLAVYAGDQAIDPAHVRELVASVRETTIFALVDAVAEVRLQGAQRGLAALLQDGAAPPYILFMLARQFRLLLMAKTLGARGVKGEPLRGRLGIADYPFRKTVEQAERYSSPALESALRRLLEADVALKTGRQQPEMALTLLVADLCRGAS